MARQRYYHDPARKNIETYQDFSGGLNVVSSNDNTKDNELRESANVDLGTRGSVSRRKGFKLHQDNVNASGLVQMYSRYYRNYTPYNLLGVEGAFDGAKQANGKDGSVGGWQAVNIADTMANLFKATREQGPDLILNGDFSKGYDSWTFSTAYSIIETISDAPIGKQCMSLMKSYNNNFQNEINEFQERWLTTKAGEQIYIEAYYANKARAGLRPPERVHIVAEVELTDGKKQFLYINKYDVSSTWKKMSGFFKMPSKAKRVRLGVGQYDTEWFFGPVEATSLFNGIYARTEFPGSQNGTLAIRSAANDKSVDRGAGLRFSGLMPNTYYVFVAEYRSDGNSVGGLAVRDERFGVFPNDNGLIQSKAITSKSTTWTTQFMRFTTYDGMSQGRAYVQNKDPLGTSGTVYYDNARIFEVTSDVYARLATMTAAEVAEMFPYRTGKLSSQTLVEDVSCVNGIFYIDGVEKPVEGGYPIQNERMMEAVPYRNALYIATGSGLFVYNGSTISKVTPYVPDPLETLYIGSNALVDNPYVIGDEVQSVVELKKIQFSRRYGVTNKFITIEVGVGKPSDKVLEYKFERRNVRDKEGYWFVLRDWDTESKTTFITDIAGEYQFRITVREKGKTAKLDDYLIPKYIIKPTDEADEPIDGSTIHLCNRILVHWDRLIMYGDDSKPDVIYISDLQNPTYFPMNNSLWFENPRKERITSIVRFRNYLTVFTASSIQALHGTNPEDYQRVMLNASVGCISDRGAKAVKNHIIFPSYDGIAALKSVGISETMANIEVLDTNIKPLVIRDPDAVAYVRNNQYCIVYPKQHKQLRYYYEWGVWTQDLSPSLDIVETHVEDEKLFAIGSDGRVITDSDDYEDEEVPFDEIIATKNFFFGESYAIKKTRELQIMFDTPKVETSLDVIISLDGNVIKTVTITIDPENEVYKIPIAGKGLFASVQLVHKENAPVILDGLGFVFKLKNP